MVELGTYVGYSAVRWASLLPEGGRLWSIDPEPAAQESAALVLKHAGLEERVSWSNLTLTLTLTTDPNPDPDH